MKTHEQITRRPLLSITERDFIKHPVWTTLVLFIGVPIGVLVGVFILMYLVVLPLGWIFSWY